MTKEMNNNSHVCAEPKVELCSGECSVERLPYTAEEFRVILDFYLFHAPIRKDSREIGDGFGLRYLGDYGWASASDLNKLEREVLKKSGITRFVLIKADTISGVLSDMDLDGKICIVHSRAVLNQLHKLSVDEYGEVKNAASEKRLVCLFRHIRNALAHNRVYLFQGDMLMLEDAAEDGKTITARVLMKTKTLLDWIEVVDNDNKYYQVSATEEFAS